MKILIVDDNGDDRRLLRYIVNNKGHEAVEAEDGLEGLRMAKIHKPDLIISDALMPVMDGFQFLRHIKEDDILRSIPFIFYSAIYKADKDVDLAIALGAHAYIVKPKEPSELWEEVEIILQEAKREEVISPELIKEDEEYLKRYSQIVATKLEEKVRALEEIQRVFQVNAENLKKSEAFIKNILESVDEGFIVIDPEFRILSANKAYCEQVKSPSSDIMGRHCYEVSHHLSRPCFLEGEECPPSHTFKTGMFSIAFHTHHDSEGTPIYLETKSYPVKDDSGKVTAVIETLNNITEKRRLEEQLRHAQKMEAIGTLAGGIAHDFNNMLNVIIGYGGLMRMSMKEDDPLLPQLKEILEAGDRAAQLTKGLLIFSRKQTLELKPVNINELIDGFKKMLGRIIGEDIELRIILNPPASPPPLEVTAPDSASPPLKIRGGQGGVMISEGGQWGGVTVMADRGHIEQVLMNLSANARDAMPKGGILSIETKQIRIDSKFIKAHGYGEPGKYALITVSDTGTGMDEKTRERIFEPYFTTKEIGSGTGLGLSIVFGIVNQHKGYIHCYSELGRGTTFKIYLPIVKMEGIEIEEIEAAVPKGGTETVVIAEDDPAVRNLIKTELESFGYSVIEAVDGEDAVKKFRENKDSVRLLLFDVIMPKKHGGEAYEDIKGIRQDMKAIFMSGYTSDIIQSKGLLEDGIEFISKPVLPNELLIKVRAALDA